jgi:hypothetical protein
MAEELFQSQPFQPSTQDPPRQPITAEPAPCSCLQRLAQPEPKSRNLPSPGPPPIVHRPLSAPYSPSWQARGSTGLAMMQRAPTDAKCKDKGQTTARAVRVRVALGSQIFARSLGRDLAVEAWAYPGAFRAPCGSDRVALCLNMCWESGLIHCKETVAAYALLLGRMSMMLLFMLNCVHLHCRR